MLARLGVIALVFGLTPVTGLQAQDNEPEPEIQPEAAQDESSGQSAAEPAPVEPTAPLPANEASTEHDEGSAPDAQDEPQQIPGIILGDGLAQWAMAFTGLGALLVSVWAVHLLKVTLKETREAVRAADDAVAVTRKIGEAQIRAYPDFTIRSIEVRPPAANSHADINGCNLFVEINVSAENTGQSPAFYPKFIYAIDVLSRHTTGAPSDVFQNFSDLKPAATSIKANGTAERTALRKSFVADIDALNAGEKDIWIYIQIEFVDVFGKTITTSPNIGTLSIAELQREKPKIFWRGIDLKDQE